VVTDALGCYDQKSIQVVVSENPVAAFHGEDTLVVAAGYILHAGEGLASYHWNTGEITESIIINQEGWYWIEMVSKGDCFGIDSIYIRIPVDCIFIPNAFTPDGDGLNDTFNAISRCPLFDYHLLIFNRWGEKLFESHDISSGWDGKKNGKLCPGDAYVYMISYTVLESQNKESKEVKYGIFVLLK
jgi:gliding motility-associated-like protein